MIRKQNSTKDTPLHRTNREVHYPPVVDVLEPYILLVHQGMVEDLFLNDMKARGVEVTRNSPFATYREAKDGSIEVVSRDDVSGEEKTLRAQYLVGTDGAHSQVRKCIPEATPVGASSEAIWGVLDGVIETDFPDLWSKVVVYSEEAGNVLCIPRERNMTRLYIELKSETGTPISKAEATQEFVMARARQIMQPYSLTWASVEWFGVYTIGQRVANRFTDDKQRVFIAGDVSPTSYTYTSKTTSHTNSQPRPVTRTRPKRLKA